MAPLVRARKGYHTEVAEWAAKQGYQSLLVDGAIIAVGDFKRLERFREHSIDVIVGEVREKTPAARSSSSSRRPCGSANAPCAFSTRRTGSTS